MEGWWNWKRSTKLRLSRCKRISLHGQRCVAVIFFSDFYTSSISSWVKLGGFYSRSWVKSGRFRLQLIINEIGYFRNLAS